MNGVRVYEPSLHTAISISIGLCNERTCLPGSVFVTIVMLSLAQRVVMKSPLVSTRAKNRPWKRINFGGESEGARQKRKAKKVSDNSSIRQRYSEFFRPLTYDFWSFFFSHVINKILRRSHSLKSANESMATSCRRTFERTHSAGS